MARWHDKFNQIGKRSARRKRRPADLQSASLRRIADAFKSENDALLRPFNPHLSEALQEPSMVEVDETGQGLDMERPILNDLIQAQNGSFHIGISASILAIHIGHEKAKLIA